jgi:hypothetical protein
MGKYQRQAKPQYGCSRRSAQQRLEHQGYPPVHEENTMSDPRDLRYSYPLMRGEDVRAIQKALTALSVQPPCGTTDGIFGNATRLSVESFQRSVPNLGIDGVVGRFTHDALFSMATAAFPQSKLLTPNAGRGAAPATPLPQISVSSLIRSNASRPPLNRRQTLQCRDWLMQHFEADIIKAVNGTPLPPLLICSIAAKETGPEWLKWIPRLSTGDILARCVFDASGDYPGTSRIAFPANTAVFRQTFGEQITADFIDEANRSRALRGMGPQTWVYKGYGILQYDLQHIKKDADFFLKKQWREFPLCLDRAMKELQDKFKAAHGDLRDTVRRYNGSGERAEIYADHVLTMLSWMQADA